MLENQKKVKYGYGKLPWGGWHETTLKKKEIHRLIYCANDFIGHFGYNSEVKSVPVDNPRKTLGEIMWKKNHHSLPLEINFDEK